MSDPDSKRRRSKHRQRNFIAKKMLEDSRYKRKIHLDVKAKRKENKFKFPEEDYEE